MGKKKKRCGFNPWGWEDRLEKGMATYSSIVAWRIPGTEEIGQDTVHSIVKS